DVCSSDLLGQIRPPTAFAADPLGHLADDLARLNPAGQIFGYAHNERDIAVVRGAQHYHARAQFVAELIDQRAHLRPFEIVHAVRQYFDAVDIFDLVGNRSDGR